jgi:nicotinamide riboside kinase
MKCINLFGGPGVGKSTLATRLFSEMKIQGYNVEYVSEYAKEMTYMESFNVLNDQLKVLAEQHHKQWILKDKVDYCIIDGPFLLSTIYYNEKYGIPKQEFYDFVVSLYNSYNNMNMLLLRGEYGYQTIGRNETFEESKEIDNRIKQMLIDTKQNFSIININKELNLNGIIESIVNN